ncbi:MAG TPA: DegV family protein [Symbiobacteriaceae bacterium]|nr:DegV family protein [Symbiobacteriaceae bacterium]
MGVVKIVTDSTASLPRELCQALGITVVPIPIQFGATTFTDGVDPAEQFYEYLMDSPAPPTTSTPSPGVFMETYRRLLAEGAEVVSIHLMGSKSTLLETARLSARLLETNCVHVIDSGSVSMGLGLLVILGARMAAAGKSAAEIVTAVQAATQQVDLFVAIREMTQLRKSGRVSLGAALLASAFSIKPILSISQSVIDVADKVRSWPKALERITQLAHERVDGTKVTLAVVHTNAKTDAEALLAQIRERFQTVEVMIAEAGAGLAAHAGSGALGVVLLRHD